MTVVAVLLPTHTVTRTRPVPTEDAHGWVTSVTEDPVVYEGNLQLTVPAAYVTANDSDDAGPYGPRTVTPGAVYLPPDADVEPGDVLTVDGTTWQVRGVRVMPDPAGASSACLVAEVSHGD